MIQLEIITPKKIWFTGKVSTALIPGVDGDFTVMENHAPVLSALRAGPLIVVEDDVSTHYVIAEGLCGVRENTATVLVEGCELLDVEDEEELEKSLRDTEEALDEATDDEKKADLKAELVKLRAVQTTLQYKKNDY